MSAKLLPKLSITLTIVHQNQFVSFLSLSLSFFTSYTCQMWRNFRFLHICHVENLKSLHKWRNFRFLHICDAYKSETSPHDKFFSTCLAGDTSSTVKKMRKFYATKNFLTNQFSALAFTFTFLSTFSFNLKTISSNFSSTKLHTALSTWSYTLNILAIYRDYL